MGSIFIITLYIYCLMVDRATVPTILFDVMITFARHNNNNNINSNGNGGIQAIQMLNKTVTSLLMWSIVSECPSTPSKKRFTRNSWWIKHLEPLNKKSLMYLRCLRFIGVATQSVRYFLTTKELFFFLFTCLNSLTCQPISVCPSHSYSYSHCIM